MSLSISSVKIEEQTHLWSFFSCSSKHWGMLLNWVINEKKRQEQKGGLLLEIEKVLGNQWNVVFFSNHKSEYEKSTKKHCYPGKNS